MAAASFTKAGIAGVTYRNTGSYGSPSWTAQDFVRDVSPATPWDMVDASIRASRAKLFGKTQIDISGQLVMKADNANAGYQAFFDASQSPTAVLDLLILDGAIADEGAMGVRAEFNISFASQSQGAGDVIYTTFDYKPAYTTNGYPKSVKMGAASTPTFTAL